MKINGHEITFERGSNARVIGYSVLIDGKRIFLHPDSSNSDRLIWKDHAGQTNELFQAIGEKIENAEM